MLEVNATESENHSTVTIEFKAKSFGYDDLKFGSVHLSSESHTYLSQWTNKYAEIILYGWEERKGEVLQEWDLNGIHCKSVFVVIHPHHPSHLPYIIYTWLSELMMVQTHQK